MRVPNLGSLVCGALFGCALIASSTPAHAVLHPDSCNFECPTDCELDTDITCSVDSGIVLFEGADLDLKGHRIICDNPDDLENICTGYAVHMMGGNSVVKDTGHPKGGILGAFAVAIDCGANPTNQAVGLTMIGIDGTAIKNCGTIDGNVVISRTQLDYVDRPGIYVEIRSTISHNYIANFGFAIQSLGSGTKTVTVDSNVIEAQAPLGGVGYSLIQPKAIVASANSALGSSVLNNTILGPAGSVAVNAATFVSNNRCDETSADCQTCITSGVCTDPAVQYLLDRSVSVRPAGLGDVSQFSLHNPGSGITNINRWVLVNDFPDGEITGSFRTSIGLPNAGSTKTQLFRVENLDGFVSPDEEYQSCVVQAHMMGISEPTHLVVKLGGVQSDGATITVAAPGPTLYTRTMTANPVGNHWTGADILDPTLQIGVKNDPSPTGGVTVGDLILRCK